MKKIFITVPFILALYACNEDSTTVKDKESVPEQKQEEEIVSKQTKNEVTYIAATTEWKNDIRLQEPTEDTICEVCNMKVYTKDHELGVFSAQSVKPDGTIAFYDDIGCLLNAELVENQTNEKFVRDYITLNWFEVEEATLVKTDIKSPMNWGYIFFAFEEDAKMYISENPTAKIEELDVVKQSAKERREKMMQKKGGHKQHSEDQHGTEETHNH